MALDVDTAAWVEGLLEAYIEAQSSVSDWERGFMSDQVERWEKFGSDIRFSPRQWDILRRVAAKLKYQGLDREMQC